MTDFSCINHSGSLEAAAILRRAEIFSIPIPLRQKAPVLPNWPNLRITAADLPRYFNGAPKNIGILLGAPSRNVVDIDLDALETLPLADMFLPPTGCRFGRPTKPASHRLYMATPLPTTEQFKAPDGTMLLELRSTNCQTVVPPSIHPSGEPIRFDLAEFPTPVDGETLLTACRLLAAVTLLVRHWPKEGSRQEAAMALAGGLLRDEWTEDETTKLLHAVICAAKDDEIEKRLKTIDDTARKLAANQPVTGWPKLGELLGSAVVKQLCAWLECESDANREIIEKFNKEHALVWVQGDCKILKEDFDPALQRRTVSFSSKQHLNLYYADHPKIRVKKRQMTAVNYWVQHPDHRKYQGLTFLPGSNSDGYYNLWQGFSVEPKEGDCSLYLAHLKDNICRGNVEHYDYLLAWLADGMQRPMNRPGTAIVFRGRTGTGKGVMATHYGRLFGQHFLHLTHSRHLLGHFNAHLAAALLVYVDEGFWAGDKSSEGVLKALITEDTHLVEFKGLNAVPMKNFIRVIISSNHDWVVPAGMDDRRFFVLDVGDKHKEDTNYFKALVNQMQSGGSQALLHYLQNYDYSEVNLRHAPKTAALMEQKVHSMTPVEKFWFECLETGSNRPGHDDWTDWVECSELHEWFVDQAKKSGSPRRATETELGTHLKKLVPQLKNDRRTVERTKWKKYSDGNSEKVVEKVRAHVWVFPSIEICRAAFDRVMNCQHSWRNTDDEGS